MVYDMNGRSLLNLKALAFLNSNQTVNKILEFIISKETSKFYTESMERRCWIEKLKVHISKSSIPERWHLY